MTCFYGSFADLVSFPISWMNKILYATLADSNNLWSSLLIPLRGLNSWQGKKVVDNGFDKSPVHGLGRGRNQNWWKSLADQLLGLGEHERIIQFLWYFSYPKCLHSFYNAYSHRKCWSLRNLKLNNLFSSWFPGYLKETAGNNFRLVRCHLLHRLGFYVWFPLEDMNAFLFCILRSTLWWLSYPQIGSSYW